MSITNLEKTLKNTQLLYCNLENKIIIECIGLSELIKKYSKNYIKKIKYFYCDTVKIITIYDIYKNIILKPIYIDLFQNILETNDILNKLKENDIYFSKTFIESFLIYNKLNDIEYIMHLNSILYNNIKIKLNLYNKIFNINYNEELCESKINWIYQGIFHYNEYCISFYKNNNVIKYGIFNNYIQLTKKSYIFDQYINIYKEKIIIKEYFVNKVLNDDIKIYEEERDNNNEIINFEKYDYEGNLVESFFSNNKNSFSKPLKKFYIELTNHYNKNISNAIEVIKSLFKKEKKVKHNLLLNYNLEIINSK